MTRLRRCRRKRNRSGLAGLHGIFRGTRPKAALPKPASNLRHPAIDKQLRPIDETRRIRSQEGHHLADLVGFAQTAQRHLRSQVVEQALAVGVAHQVAQSGRALPFRFQHKGEHGEVKLEHRVGVNESNAHLAAAIAGLGIIQTFTYAAGPAIARGELVEVLRRWRPAAYPFHVVYPQNRHLTHRLRVFIEWLLESFPARLAG